MPNAKVREDLGLRHLHRWTFISFRCRKDVLVRQHQQEIAQVVGRTPQPVLKAQHEAAGILRFFNRQVLENGGQRVQQLEHGVLETGASGFLPLLHEASNGALALTELRHGEAAQLVEPHHLGHGREDHRCFQAISVRRHCINNLLCQVLDEDQRGDKHIRLGHVCTEPGVVVLVSQFLDQVAAQLDSEITTRGVKRSSCLG